jgi:hypothetical protein
MGMAGTLVTLMIVYRVCCSAKRSARKLNAEHTSEISEKQASDVRNYFQQSETTGNTNSDGNFIIASKCKIATTSSFVKNKKLKPSLSRIDYNAEDLVSETDEYAPEDLRVPSNFLPSEDNLRQAFQAKSQNRSMFHASAYADGAVPNPLYANAELVTSVYMTNDSANLMASRAAAVTSAQCSEILDNVHGQTESRVTLRAMSAVRSQTFEQGVARSLKSLRSMPSAEEEEHHDESDQNKQKY